ncbi:50S ribosomal protein L10 [Candidatus Thorarchaeota archaeon]|nr:MAG: 50S ribosomal protein L10 [Candidatus Thorarchaeota archaeon]
MALEDREVPQWKKNVVNELVGHIESSKMVGLVNVEGVGAKQLQGIRESLRGSAKIQMARNTLMKRAIEDAKVDGVDQLEKHVTGPVAFVFSEQDPFLLSKFLSENKAQAPAKGGQVAPKNIIVPAMNTGVAPGPFISELAALEIPSRVKGGVIHVTEDTVAVEAGEVISNAMAQMLARLGIEPMELQLKLIAAYTDGVVLTGDTLEVDLEQIFKQVMAGHQYAVNLSINAGYPTTDTVPMIVAKANMEAKSLALKIGFFEPDLVNEFLGKANSEALAFASLLAEKNPEAVPSDVLSQVKSAAAASAPSAPAEEPEEESEDEEDEEDEAVAGLGGLFG